LRAADALGDQQSLPFDEVDHRIEAGACLQATSASRSMGRHDSMPASLT